ncbi:MULTISPECIES: hypothetical protein [unclassified Methylococcus]|uniref:hypothetical protein n=1 Tax=unclassified Methylococcus TaxID=2618889 RepID=UPI003D7E0E1B
MKDKREPAKTTAVPEQGNPGESFHGPASLMPPSRKRASSRLGELPRDVGFEVYFLYGL